MSRATVIIHSKADRDKIATWARNVEFGTVVEFRQSRRTLDQNSLLWAILGEVAQQVEWYGQKLSSDDWKDMFTASLRRARVVPGIDAGTFVPLGMRTSDMTKQEFGELIELIYAFGAERGVIFADHQNSAADAEPAEAGALVSLSETATKAGNSASPVPASANQYNRMTGGW